MIAALLLSLYGGVSATSGSGARSCLASCAALDISWETRSLQAPFYYGARLWQLWPSGFGAAVEFLHDKAYAVSGLPKDVSDFNMSHGVNHLWLEGVRRFGLAGVPLRAHLLAGAGVVIPHVEAMVGAQSIGEYQWSNGVSALAAAGASVALADFLELFAEYRFSAARVRADLPNGALWTSLWTHHLAIGFSFASP